MRLEHSLPIAASPDVVWDVTLDIERWPEWTPTMQSVKRLDVGPFRVGSQARIKQPQFREAVWTVTAIDPGRSFTWQTRTSGLTMIATHEVLPEAAGCISKLSLEIRGLLAFVLAPLVRRGALQAMTTENAKLRERCQTIQVNRK